MLGARALEQPRAAARPRGPAPRSAGTGAAAVPPRRAVATSAARSGKGDRRGSRGRATVSTRGPAVPVRTMTRCSAAAGSWSRWSSPPCSRRAARLAFYLEEVRPPGSVFNEDVPFEDTPEATPGGRPDGGAGGGAGEAQAQDGHVRLAPVRLHGHAPARLRAARAARGPFRRVWRAGDRPARVLARDRGRHARSSSPTTAGSWRADKKTGKRRWRRKLGTLAAASPAVEGKNLYVTVLETLGGGAGRVVSLRLRDGKIRWSRALPSRAESSPLVDQGRMYFGSEDGTVYCVDEDTGGSSGATAPPGAVKGSPTLANGLLYFGDYGGQVQAVRASNGRRVWANGSARGLRADGHLLRHRGGRLRPRLHRQHGRPHVLLLRPHAAALAWARQTGSYVYSSAAVKVVDGLGPTVYFGSYDNRLLRASTRARARCAGATTPAATSPARRPSSATRSTSPARRPQAHARARRAARAAACSGPWRAATTPWSPTATTSSSRATRRSARSCRGAPGATARTGTGPRRRAAAQRRRAAACADRRPRGAPRAAAGRPAASPSARPAAGHGRAAGEARRREAPRGRRRAATLTPRQRRAPPRGRGRAPAAGRA